ncbi:MAG TPA: arsenate reductase ArsC, partial [Dehalococcoidia bacterium]|nr:arsenate reductase ArsC [Dehalococcoidia bacterium]
MAAERVRVLFLCTPNSARSQMAEGWLRAIGGDRFEVHSAGTEATFVRPLAIRVMAEVGVDISNQSSKTLDPYLDEPWDGVITVCDHANDACPVFPGAARRLHWSSPDPSRVTGDEAQQLTVYRQVRDAIRAQIEDFWGREGMMPIRALFLCAGNSARSQIAQALLRRIGGSDFDVHSAGTAPQPAIHPRAIAVLAERDLTVDGQRPKDVRIYEGQHFDYVITVCDRAAEDCPTFPHAETIHWTFPDPASPSSEAEQDKAFRDVLTGLDQRIRLLPIRGHPRARAGWPRIGKARRLDPRRGRSAGGQRRPRPRQGLRLPRLLPDGIDHDRGDDTQRGVEDQGRAVAAGPVVDQPIEVGADSGPDIHAHEDRAEDR